MPALQEKGHFAGVCHAAKFGGGQHRGSQTRGSRAQRSATGEASKAREERPMLHLGCEQTDPIVVDVSVRLVWGVNCRHRGSAFAHTANFTMEMTDLVSTKKVAGTAWMWPWMEYDVVGLTEYTTMLSGR